MRAPLHQAAWTGDVARVRELLAAGAQIEAFTDTGQSPLHLAIENLNLEVVRVLLDARADVNALTEGGWTPLFHAVEIVSDAASQVRKQPDNTLLRMLLDSGADPNLLTAERKSALWLARRYRNKEAVEILLAYGAHDPLGSKRARG